MATFKYIPKLV